MSSRKQGGGQGVEIVGSGGTAQLQKVQQSTDQITKEQSLTLMKNLVRTAISSIAYLRNLFPEDCFRDKKLTGVTVKTLLPNDLEARLLIQWMEEGVFDALQKKYLDTIIFAIYNGPKTDSEAQPELLECYNFRINYPDDDSDGVSLSVSRKGENGQVELHSKDQIKNATVRMIRTLVTLAQTLKGLPADRYLTVKLLYRDEYTPDDYEPKFFHAPPPHEQLLFASKPVKIRIGKVDTPFHEMSLKIKTAVDCFGDELSQPKEPASFDAEESTTEDEEQGPKPKAPPSTPTLAPAAAAEKGDQEMESSQKENQPPASQGRKASMERDASPETDRGESEASGYELVSGVLDKFYREEGGKVEMSSAAAVATKALPRLAVPFLNELVRKYVSEHTASSSSSPTDIRSRIGSLTLAGTSEYEVFVKHVVATQTTAVTKLDKTFPALPVRDYMARMLREGLVERVGGNRYKISAKALQQAPAVSGSSSSSSASSSSSTSLPSGPADAKGGKGGAPASKATATAGAGTATTKKAALVEGPLPALLKRKVDAKELELSMSQLSPTDQSQGPPDSEEGSKRRRKTSTIEHPIHQVAK